jgi:hypothetical protein
MAVAAAKGQRIVELKEIRHSHSLPASHKRRSDLAVSLASARLQIGLMGGYVDNVERIKPPIAFDVTRPNDVGLMDIVAAQGLRKVWVLNPFGSVASFF